MVQLVVVQSLDSGHIASETLHPRTKLKWVVGFLIRLLQLLEAISKPRHKMNKLVQPFSKPYFCGARQLTTFVCMYVCMYVCHASGMQKWVWLH